MEELNGKDNVTNDSTKDSTNDSTNNSHANVGNGTNISNFLLVFESYFHIKAIS